MAARPPHLALQLFWRRAHFRARQKAFPFNLKEAGRKPLPALTRPLSLPPLGWLGAWVDVGPTGRSPALSRLAAYSLNAVKLWVATPSLGGVDPQSQHWLSAALRGLTGLVSLKLRFKGKSFRWHRRRGALVLRFGHSHLVACPPPSTRDGERGARPSCFSSTQTSPCCAPSSRGSWPGGSQTVTTAVACGCPGSVLSARRVRLVLTAKYCSIMGGPVQMPKVGLYESVVDVSVVMLLAFQALVCV